VPRVSVIIPTWNGADMLAVALESLDLQVYRDFETVVVDNGSTDGTIAMLDARFERVRQVRLPENRGFASAVNEGICAARGEILVLMNNDVRAEPGWLGALVAALDAHPEAGSVASRMLDAKRPGIIDAAGDTMALMAWNVGRGEPDGARFAVGREVLSACAGAAAYRRAMLDRIGVLDESYFAWFEDVDLGIRAQLAGWRCWYEPGAVVHHLGSATAARMSTTKTYFTVRNAMLLFFKTMPLRRIAAWGIPMLVWPLLDPIMSGRSPRVTVRAWLAFWRMLPGVLRARRSVFAAGAPGAGHLLRLLESPWSDFVRAWDILAARIGRTAAPPRRLRGLGSEAA
jgi:GT2 family glycosyltransferase